VAFDPDDDLAIREEITVRDVLVPVWLYRRFITILVVIGLVLAMSYQFWGTPIYTAQITIAPLPTDLTLSQQGNSIAGLSLLSSVSGSGSSQGPSDFDTFTALLQSPEIAHNLEKNYHVKQYIFANSWDAKKKQWTSDREFFLVKFGRILLNKPWHPPTDQDLALYLSKKVDLTTVGPFTILSFNFKDQKVAKMVLGGLVAEAQQVIRNQQRVRANAALAFLNKQLGTSPSSMAEQALIALSIEWEQKELLAQNDLDVGVEISQPLTVSDTPTSPAPLLDIAIGIGASAFLGIVLAVILGLFVSDDPAFIANWFRRRWASFVTRTKSFGELRYRFER